MFGNLLEAALSIIPKQTFIYTKYKGVSINDIGIKQIEYEAPVTLEGSVQAVKKDMYEKLGLDWSKRYISIHASADIRNPDNDQPAPDKIGWNGKEYLVTSATEWHVQDGWNAVIAVENNIEDEEEEEEQQENANS